MPSEKPRWVAERVVSGAMLLANRGLLQPCTVRVR
jgi:hypothetical protein